MASATVAPISRVVRTSTVRDHVTMEVAMAIDATAALPTARRVSIVAAAAVPVQDHAQAAPTSRTTHPTPVRDPSIQTIVHGDATQDTMRRTASATAAPISHAVPTSTARAHAITRRATDTSAIAAPPTARRVSIVVAAVARVQARVLAARTHRRMLIIRAKAQSI